MLRETSTYFLGLCEVGLPILSSITWCGNSVANDDESAVEVWKNTMHLTQKVSWSNKTPKYPGLRSSFHQSPFQIYFECTFLHLEIKEPYAVRSLTTSKSFFVILNNNEKQRIFTYAYGFLIG